MSPFSETLSLTVAIVSTPKIGTLRAYKESDSQIRLTVKSDNAGANNQQLLTIKRSVNGVDFTSIYTQLLSDRNLITYYDNAVQYPTRYFYQAFLYSTGGTDTSRIVNMTPMAPPDPTEPTVSYSLTNQQKQSGVEYAAVLCTITKTSPDTHAESYEVFVEPQNSSDVILVTDSITNQGDTTTITTSTYNDDEDHHIYLSVIARREIGGSSSWTTRTQKNIEA